MEAQPRKLSPLFPTRSMRRIPAIFALGKGIIANGNSSDESHQVAQLSSLL